MDFSTFVLLIYGRHAFTGRRRRLGIAVRSTAARTEASRKPPPSSGSWAALRLNQPLQSEREREGEHEEGERDRDADGRGREPPPVRWPEQAAETGPSHRVGNAVRGPGGGRPHLSTRTPTCPRLCFGRASGRSGCRDRSDVSRCFSHRTRRTRSAAAQHRLSYTSIQKMLPGSHVAQHRPRERHEGGGTEGGPRWPCQPPN